jgi:hypothetical protein
MPYTKKEDREKYEPILGELRKKMREVETSKGDLTYLVYCLGLEYFKDKESYTNMSSAISSLCDAAEEIRRVHLNPYEEKKIKENGDVE